MARYVDVKDYRKLFDEEYKKIRKLISEGKTHLDNLAEGFCGASRVIDRMPAADVVEVVRCKDCKYSRERNEDERQYLVEGVLICTSVEATDECWNPVYPSHFCGCGERKE